MDHSDGERVPEHTRAALQSRLEQLQALAREVKATSERARQELERTVAEQHTFAAGSHEFDEGRSTYTTSLLALQQRFATAQLRHAALAHDDIVRESTALYGALASATSTPAALDAATAQICGAGEHRERLLDVRAKSSTAKFAIRHAVLVLGEARTTPVMRTLVRWVSAPNSIDYLTAFDSMQTAIDEFVTSAGEAGLSPEAATLVEHVSLLSAFSNSFARVTAKAKQLEHLTVLESMIGRLEPLLAPLLDESDARLQQATATFVAPTPAPPAPEAPTPEAPTPLPAPAAVTPFEFSPISFTTTTSSTDLPLLPGMQPVSFSTAFETFTDAVTDEDDEDDEDESTP